MGRLESQCKNYPDLRTSSFSYGVLPISGRAWMGRGITERRRSAWTVSFAAAPPLFVFHWDYGTRLSLSVHISSWGRLTPRQAASSSTCGGEDLLIVTLRTLRELGNSDSIRPIGLAFDLGFKSA